jgi:hypothetical protein
MNILPDQAERLAKDANKCLAELEAMIGKVRANLKTKKEAKRLKNIYLAFQIIDSVSKSIGK